MSYRTMRPGILALSLVVLLCQASLNHADHLRELQAAAERDGRAEWGHWGVDAEDYTGWQSHSNRLIPVYTFGISLDLFSGENSIYRDAKRLETLYGRLPERTLDPDAGYFDQTDIFRLQQRAVAEGKKHIILVVFDGMDWDVTRAAAIAKSGNVYDAGRGGGLFVQDYRGTTTDFGLMVTSPTSGAARLDVNGQVVIDGSSGQPGGYDAALGGATAWDSPVDLAYLIGKNRSLPHAVVDSAASAMAMTTGVKSYNGAINVTPSGEQIEPIARRLQRDGFSVGVVTSVPISHATPAAAYANNVTRDDYQDLSRDLLGVASVAHREEPLPGMDVVLGTGWGVDADDDSEQQGTNFVPGNKYLPAETLEKIDRRNGGNYRVVQRDEGKHGATALAEAAKQARRHGDRLFGYFGTATANLPYATADGKFDPLIAPPEVRAKYAPSQMKYNPARPYSRSDLHENPTLADMTKAALTVLSRNEKGFWLLVEAGDVDWAMHANNLDNAIGAIHSGDEAFLAIVRWVETHDAWEDTAVILTADHGHLFVLTKPAALIAR